MRSSPCVMQSKPPPRLNRAGHCCLSIAISWLIWRHLFRLTAKRPVVHIAFYLRALLVESELAAIPLLALTPIWLSLSRGKQPCCIGCLLVVAPVVCLKLAINRFPVTIPCV